MRCKSFLSIAPVVLLAGFLLAADVDPFDQSKVPIEVQPTDASLAKIVLVAGRQSHGPGDHEFFAGCTVLMKLLQQTPGVFPVMARDGWPTDSEATFKGAKAIVLYMDGGDNHPALQEGHSQIIQKATDDGVGFVNLHYAVEYPKKSRERVFNWLGGYYETGYSTNPHWQADFKELPDHAITRGVKPFAIRDEWYYCIRFDPTAKGVTPILKATPPDDTRGTEEAKSHKGRFSNAFFRMVLGWGIGFRQHPCPAMEQRQASIASRFCHSVSATLPFATRGHCHADLHAQRDDHG